MSDIAPVLDSEPLSDRPPDKSDDDKRSVRGISLEDWNAFVSAAKRERMPVGPWLARAGRAYIKSARHLPAVVPQAPDIAGQDEGERPTQGGGVSDIAQIADIAERWAAAGVEPSPAQAKRLWGSLLAHLPKRGR